MTDALSALRSFVAADIEVARQTTPQDGSPRVYAVMLPEDREQEMPVKTVVLIAAGGVEEAGAGLVTRHRIDAVCYGKSDSEAAELERSVAAALINLDREVVDGVLLHSAMISGGPLQARHPETGWPAMRRTLTLRADTREV